MEKQISIIIPTYNMEKYIGKCLDSLLIPEFDQVEVLVVNDGSKDRSSEIAHSYADRYLGSIRVIDKPNGNYGSCINAALPLATGRYVKVLDADDTFDTEAFSKFVRILPNVDDDMIITEHTIVDENDSKVREETYRDLSVDYDVTLVQNQAYPVLCSSYLFMHNITYNRNIFDRFRYKQTEGISYTDNQWAFVPSSYCMTFRFLQLSIYRYLVGRADQTVSMSVKQKSLHQFEQLANALISDYKRIEGSEISRKYLLIQVGRFHCFFYNIVKTCNNRRAYDIMKSHDYILKEKFPELYDLIGEEPYSKGVDFKIYQDIRKKNYPDSYNIPFIVRVEVSLKSRLKRLFSK